MTDELFTVVLGVDGRHLQLLELATKQWHRRGRGIEKMPWIVFYDKDEVSDSEIQEALDGPHGASELTLVSWPPATAKYTGDKAQRHKMLAGFVHVAAEYAQTPYWLKIDLDVMATESGDWIDYKWFTGSTAIVASPWGYTKPADQMHKLDAWFDNGPVKGWLENRWGSVQPPLNLPMPEPDAPRIRHPRIASWLSFYSVPFTVVCSSAARLTEGIGSLPVPSQDGYMWYMAQRLNLPVNRVQMKKHGWSYKSGVSRARLRLERDAE